jgi:hypothetical protein
MLSWKRSRQAALWRRLEPAKAMRVMADCYGDGAGAEILLRAFLEERDMNPDGVRFWLSVYAAVREASDEKVDPRRLTSPGERGRTFRSG